MKNNLMELVDEYGERRCYEGKGVRVAKKTGIIKAKIQTIADEWERMQWVSVKDRLPEESEEKIIAWDSEEEIEIPIHKPCLKWRDFFDNDRDFLSHWRYPINPPTNKGKS